MLVLTPDQYSQPGFADRLKAEGLDRNMCKLVLSGNKSVQMPTRIAMLNIVYWETLMQFGILPTINETFNIKSVSSDSSSKIYSILYDKFLDERPNEDHMKMVFAIFNNIGRLYNFVITQCGMYMPSIDALSLAKLLQYPPLKELASHKYNSAWGTHVAETMLKQDSKGLIKILKDAKTPDNILYYYLQAGVLKTNQIPQMLLAYGPRSDIDDTMRKNVISDSSFSGLKSVEDFATESLSAKKAIFFSRDVIKKTQYFGRKMRLCCSTLEKVYPGSCGSTTNTMPFKIEAPYARNFLHKVLIDNGHRVQLNSEDSIKPYIGKTVQMVTPFGCHHTDGFCEICAGYGKDRLIKYLPHGIHIGLLSSSKVSSEVSQRVLSTKHLITTNSKIYNLTESAARYLMKNDSDIFIDPKVRKQISKLSIRISMDAIGPIVDLNLDTLPIAETFSKLSYFELVQDDQVIDTVYLEYDVFIPYMSEYLLEHMRNNYDKLQIDEDTVTIPMGGFDTSLPVFKFTVVNDDMLTYTKSVSTFLTATIRNFTSVPLALKAFTDVVWRKSNINIFFLEVVLRNLLIEDENSWQLPQVQDMNHVKFGKLEDVISNRTISMKLSFERLLVYLNTPSTSTVARPVGLFGPFFGIL